MINIAWRFCVFFLIAIGPGCSSIKHQDITRMSNVNVIQPPADSHVRLTTNVYKNESGSALRLSGSVRNTTGNPITAGHVHAILLGAQHEVLAERRFALFQNGGAPRLHRSSNKTFSGEIVAQLPPDFSLRVAYHTASN